MMKRHYLAAVASLAILADLVAWIFMMSPSVEAKNVVQGLQTSGVAYPCQGTAIDPCTGYCITGQGDPRTFGQCPGTAKKDFQNNLAINQTKPGSGSVTWSSLKCYQYANCKTGQYGQNQECSAKGGYGQGNCVGNQPPFLFLYCANCSTDTFKTEPIIQWQNGGSEG